MYCRWKSMGFNVIWILRGSCAFSANRFLGIAWPCKKGESQWVNNPPPLISCKTLLLLLKINKVFFKKSTNISFSWTRSLTFPGPRNWRQRRVYFVIERRQIERENIDRYCWLTDKSARSKVWTFSSSNHR